MSGLSPRQLRGVVPPLLTPFTAGGAAVDPDGIGRLVEHVLAGGVRALFVAGTTGEFAALGEGDWRILIEATVRTTRGRALVLAGVSHNTTAGAIALARAAANLGADAVVATTPYYFRHTQGELFAHYQALAAASPLPLLLYNIPQNTGNAIEPATVAALARKPNVIGLKDSAGGLEGVRRLRRLVGPDFRLLLGTDNLGDVTLLLGADGTVPSIANLVPSLVVDAWAAAEAGDRDRAATLHERVAALAAVYGTAEPGSAGGFVAALRHAMLRIGLPVGPARAPIGPLSAAGEERVEAILREAGLPLA